MLREAQEEMAEQVEQAERQEPAYQVVLPPPVVLEEPEVLGLRPMVAD
jgi:hypothetical protein